MAMGSWGQAWFIVVIFLARISRITRFGVREDDGGQFGNGLTLKVLRKRRMG